MRKFEPPRSQSHAVVSAIIPARNEETSIARAVESVAAQPEVDEVIVVDDGSNDGTAAILEELAARLPKLSVLPAGELPAGWVGKNHAAAVGAAAAKGEWLLFTDADTFHSSNATRRALADAAEHDAALVSYSPQQEMETWWERALIPFVFCQLARRYSYTRVNDSAQPDAAANGQFLMIRRHAYDEIGGHAAIAGEVLEDVQLARRVKGKGFKIYFTAPSGVVKTRMYRTFTTMWEGWTKNLYDLVGGDSKSAIRELTQALMFPTIFTLLFLFSRNAMFRDWRLCLVVGATALIVWHTLYGIELYRSRYQLSNIKYLVPGVCLYSAALTFSWWKHKRGTIEWKGRTYRPRTERG
jgi:glycosyltransferase involved in cell wall biosynthesis